MRTFLISFFSFLIVPLHAQTVVPRIDWQEGETKHLSDHITIRITTNGVTELDTSLLLTSTLRIRDVTDTSCTVIMEEDNLLIRRGSTFYPGLTRQPLCCSTLVSVYRVNKDSLTSRLANKRAYDSLVAASYREITGIIARRAPAEARQATLILGRIRDGLTEKVTTTEVLNQLLTAYRIRYSLKDTLYGRDTLINPLNLPMFTGAQTKTYVERPARHTLKIISEMHYDLENYKKILSEMPEEMTLPNAGKITLTTDHGKKKVEKLTKSMITKLLESMELNGSETIILTKRKKQKWPEQIGSEKNTHLMITGQKKTIYVNSVIDINPK